MLKIQCIGHLGSDAQEVKNVASPFISFSIAANVGKDKQPIWLDCTYNFDNGTSPKITQYLTKGKEIFIEGRPYPKVIKDKEGSITGSTVGVFVSVIELLGKKE